MSLTAKIPADVLATAPRSWTYSENGMGSRTIDRKWVEAWHRKDEFAMAARVAAARNSQKSGGARVMLTETALRHLSAELSRKQVFGLSRNIINAAAAFHDMDPAMLTSPSRVRPITLARQHAMYEIHRQCWWLSLPQIGKMFDRDHTTILHAVRAWPKKAAKSGIVCLPLRRHRAEAA